jgi:hypothetical protein
VSSFAPRAASAGAPCRGSFAHYCTASSAACLCSARHQCQCSLMWELRTLLRPASALRVIDLSEFALGPDSMPPRSVMRPLHPEAVAEARRGSILEKRLRGLLLHPRRGKAGRKKMMRHPRQAGGGAEVWPGRSSRWLGVRPLGWRWV